jgi:hypothetical protein
MRVNQSKNVFNYWSNSFVIYSTVWIRSYDQRNSFTISLLMLVKTSSLINTSVLNPVIHFKLGDSLADLINDLRSLIITHQKANSIIETFKTFFIDRRYHKNFSSRINQNRRYLLKKKCFVCQKEKCWFIKLSKDERETTKQKFKNRLNRFFIRIDHYISEYERTNLSSSFYSENDSDTDLNEIKTLIINLSILSLISNNTSNVETFITSFDFVDNAEIMIINLANRSLSHFLINNSHINTNDQALDDIQTDLKMSYFFDLVHICMKNIIMKNIDFFIYIIIERYTSEMFYDIMIDSRASILLIDDYEQYLTFIKNISIDLNRIKTDTVNVQFEIESISSVESITIDISIELVKFYVIKTNTLFLLNLADMNRLKVYFNNVENILFMIIKNRNLSMIRRFDHEFLLWKNSYFLHSYITQFFELNLRYLTDVELRHLYKRFDHSFTLKLHDILERFDHDVEKAVLKKLTKFCIFCQKYAKSSERFKFTLKDEVNFNYSVIVDVMYIENSFVLHVIDDATRFQIAK